jgi:hypothetical protein
MLAKKVCLRAVMINREGKSTWSGEYACSICGQRFHPHASEPAKLSNDFETHKQQHHNQIGPDEDANRTAT